MRDQDRSGQPSTMRCRQVPGTRHCCGQSRQPTVGLVERPVPTDDDARIREILSWLEQNLAAPVDLADLAARAHLSSRQFSRRFRAVTGQSPLGWLVRQRVAASLPYFDAGDDPVEQIAAKVGFANAVTFRHHFRASMHTSPSAYRRAFRSGRSGLAPLGSQAAR